MHTGPNQQIVWLEHEHSCAPRSKKWPPGRHQGAEEGQGQYGAEEQAGRNHPLARRRHYPFPIKNLPALPPIPYRPPLHNDRGSTCIDSSLPVPFFLTSRMLAKEMSWSPLSRVNNQESLKTNTSPVPQQRGQACAAGHREVVEWMLSAKGGALADLCRSPSKIGMTPCIAAAAGGHAQVLDILLSRRAAQKDPEAFCPLSASDDKGNNALHHAGMSGSEAVAKLLCSSVAPPPWTANRSGKTPLQVGLNESIGKEPPPGWSKRIDGKEPPPGWSKRIDGKEPPPGWSKRIDRERTPSRLV